MREGGKLAFHLPLLCFHPAAIREQLFGCCSEQVHCLIRLCHIIASTKWIQPCFIHIPNHAARWQLTCLPLAGPLSPVCHVGFLSILAVIPAPFPPSFPHPALSHRLHLFVLQHNAMSPRGDFRLRLPAKVYCSYIIPVRFYWKAFVTTLEEGYINDQKKRPEVKHLSFWILQAEIRDQWVCNGSVLVSKLERGTTANVYSLL